MIKKCDFPGCEKAGTCRAPKSRDLKDFHYFCREHAAEYNKNWNYYAGMTDTEMERDWEQRTFGSALKDKKQAQIDTTEYLEFLNGFITGRGNFDRLSKKRVGPPSAVVAAFGALDLPVTASKKEVQTQYRRLAKIYHPDTAKKLNPKSAAEKFASISSAYQTLEKYFKKV